MRAEFMEKRMGGQSALPTCYHRNPAGKGQQCQTWLVLDPCGDHQSMRRCQTYHVSPHARNIGERIGSPFIRTTQINKIHINPTCQSLGQFEGSLAPETGSREKQRRSD